MVPNTDPKWYRFTIRDAQGKESTSEQSFKTDRGAIREFNNLKKKAEKNKKLSRDFRMPVKLVRIEVREKVADLTPSSVPAGADNDFE